MIKSTAIVIGLLFVISSSYYLSFWSRLNIDVFQYIEIEDIIKGVAYSLRTAISWFAIIISMITIAVALEKFKAEPKKRIYYILKEIKLFYYAMGITFALCIAFGSYINSNDKLNIYILDILADIFPILAAISTMSTYRLAAWHFGNARQQLRVSEARGEKWILSKIKAAKENAINPNEGSSPPFETFVNYATIGAFFYFLTSAIVLGVSNAERIIQGVEYDYVTNIELPDLQPNCNKSKIIYLGTLSDKYIFADSLKYSHFAVEKDKFPILHVFHLSSKRK